MHGVFIEKGLSDWQIVQHTDGRAAVSFSGTWIVPVDAIRQGVEKARPVIRLLQEEDNSQIIPWTYTESTPDETDPMKGTWSAEMTIPAGGLYRIETGLETYCTHDDIVWMFRGDARLHVGVGDVFIMGGQSNSAGHGKDTGYDAPELGVHVYRNREEWDLASHPLNESSFGADSPNADMGVSGVGPHLQFAKMFRRISHYPVGLIATAMGGMPMKRWAPGKGKLYNNMLERARKCGPVAGVIWYQGCNDTDHKCVDYKDRYYEMINAFRRDLGYDVKFFTFQLNRQINGENDPGWGMVKEAQRMAAHDIKDVYVLPTLGASLSDGIHNSAHANMLYGERMAKLAGHVLYGAPEFAAPDITGAVSDGSTVALTFSNVRAGFVLPANSGKDSGFTVTDSRGEVKIETISSPKEGRKDQIFLHLERPLQAGGEVSFGWQADPVACPITDAVTYLPLLAFYRYPVKENK